MFSLARQIISPQRCALSPEMISILMMEKVYLQAQTDLINKEMNFILGRKQVIFELTIR
jgi:hypothetical protein